MGLLAKSISYPAGGITVPGFLCLPEGQSTRGTIIVLHGSDGFKPNHEKTARTLAGEGFAALALTWFGGASARSHWSELRSDDLLPVVDFLQQRGRYCS